MGIRDLQDFIERDCQSAVKPVDLLRIGRTFSQAQRNGQNFSSGDRLKLIVDAESCLDRLYGGFYSDWACGGQWNRMVHFLGILMQACHHSNMQLVMFFNGAFENERLGEWGERMGAEKKKVASVLKHIHHKATPPPKVWWLAPVCLRQALRMSLRQMGVTVICSMDDHHQEVIAYCRENNFHGLIGQDGDYAIFDPPRYFSSHDLKLTYKQALETREFMMDEVAQALDLNPDRFCLLATLLGNHILTENDLKGFLDEVCPSGSKGSQRIKGVVDYVRRLESVDDLDAISQDIFKSFDSDAKRLRFKKSIQYYMNGTKEGFLNYKPKGIEQAPVKLAGSYPDKSEAKKPTPVVAEKKEEAGTEEKNEEESKEEKETTETEKPDNEEGKGEDEEEEEGEDNEPLTDLKADSYYTNAESGYAKSDNPEIVINSPTTPRQQSFDEAISSIVKDLNMSRNKSETTEDNSEKINGLEELPGADEFAEKGDACPKGNEEASNKKKKEGKGKENGSEDKGRQVVPEIMRIATERHQKGLMSAWIYQVLSQGEVKLDISLEDENSRDLPTAVDFYRQIRQNVYAILFDLNKRRPNAKYPGKEVVIREWRVPRGATTPRVETVKALPLEWKVPTVRRLWLGQTPEDKKRRLKAFLTCMWADNQCMLNVYHVPQHLLIMACVLRFIVSQKEYRVLRKHELDAFLCAAISPLLHDVETMQEMKLPMITSRGAQLAALFMRGVETAIFANDACGAPIPWSMCCPWLFFDGKLFHFKLLKANNNASLLDMCDGKMDQMMRVERLRAAILDNVQQEPFAKPPLPLMQPPHYGAGSPYYNPPNEPNYRPAGAPPMCLPTGGPMGRGIGRGRGLLGRSPVDSRGGQLQIAGVVVGNWGPNVTGNPGRPGSRPDNDVHVTTVGPPRRGIMGGGRGLVRGGRMVGARPAGSNSNILPYRNQTGMLRYNNATTKSGNRGNTRGGKCGGNNRNKCKVRGPAGYNPKVTLEQKTKIPPVGRGCTVELPGDGTVVPLSELIGTKSEGSDDCDLGQFMDAEPVPHPQIKVEQGQGETEDYPQYPEPVKDQPEMVKTQPELVETQPELVETQPELVETQPEPVESQPELVETKSEPVETKPEPVETKPEPVETRTEPVKHAEVKVKLDEDVVEEGQEIGTWVPWNHSE